MGTLLSRLSCFTSTWGTKNKGCDPATFVTFVLFSQHLGVLGPPITVRGELGIGPKNVEKFGRGLHIYIYIYRYIYIYICYWVHLRPPKTGLERSFAAPQALICGPPLFDTTVFVARNRFFAVSGNQVSSLFSDFSGFSKMPFWRSTRSFFAVQKNFRFLPVFLAWGLRDAVQEVGGRETLQNKGFRSNFAFWYLVRWRWTRCIASMLHEFFENNFWGSHKFVFSEVRIFDQIGFGRQKTAWGCRTEVVLKMTFFPFFPGGDQFVKFLARFRCTALSRFGSESGRCQKSACGCGADGFFRVFWGSSFDTVFANLKRDLLKLPSLLFVLCSFLRFLLEFGSTQPCTCVLGQSALNLFFFLFFCLSVYKNTVFSPEKGLFLFISLCLSFFLLGFIHFSFSLSVSLFLLFFLLSFLVLLFLVVTFLFSLFFVALFLCFCFMTTTTSKYYM